MKKITLLILLFISTSIVFSQEKEEFPQDINKKEEVKINALTLLSVKWIDVSYERLIDEESSFGISATLNTDTSETDLKYALTPFYRRYFSGKFARGFFVEGFGTLFSTRENDFLFSNDEPFETGFAVGISIGGKFVSKKGFTTELLLGVGRNMVESNYNEGFVRAGISVGYRF